MTTDTQNPQSQSGQTVIIQQSDKKSNGVGTSGFVLALIALFLGWVPFLGWILWLLGLILSFVGVLFLALIIFAGVSWMTAGGNDQKIEKAKNLIINAAIGLLIVLAAYAITSFIGSKFT